MVSDWGSQRPVGGPAVAAVLAGACAFAGWAVRGRSSQLIAPSVWRAPIHRKAVALTFDDGPSRATPELLELLASSGAPATFFLVGSNARRYPEIVRAIVAAGHEIGNHTDTHPRLWLRSPAYILGEMERAQLTLEQLTGIRPLWFRAPYGVRWPGLAAAQQRLRLNGVTWTVIGRDWSLDTKGIADRVLRGCSNGAIICLHDGRETAAAPDISRTIESVRIIIPELRRRGYSFETLSDLLCPQTN